MTFFFILNAILNIAMIWPILFGLQVAQLQPADVTAMLKQFPGIMAVIIIYSGKITFLLLVVLFCIWIFRANQNARALGAQGMKFSPGWCVGWFFIPIMNFIKPYQAVREIWRASSSDEAIAWDSVQTPLLLKVWWTLWVLSQFLVFSRNQQLPSVTTLLIVASIPLLLKTILPLLALKVVREIYKLQEDKLTVSKKILVSNASQQ